MYFSVFMDLSQLTYTVYHVKNEKQKIFEGIKKVSVYTDTY